MTVNGSAGSRKILLITNVDRGEANVFLATAHELLQADPDVELHIATFSGLETAILDTWQHGQLTAPEAKQITYHEIRGLSMVEGLQKYFKAREIPTKGDYLPRTFLEPLSFSNSMRAIDDSIPIFVPYCGPEFVEVFLSIVDIIQQVNAGLVVVDSLMTPALTACYHLKIQFACLSPNAIKDFAAPKQPYRSGLWKYPAFFSGFPYPVPWHLIPLNIFYSLYAAKTFLQDDHRRSVEKYLATHTGASLRTPLDLIRNPPAGLRILVSTFPELDFPAVRPGNIFPCGPILRNAPPISEVDPGLEAWLCKRPTVYVNLGSICRVDEEQASQLALALKAVLNNSAAGLGTPGLQVLWKLKKFGEYEVVEAGCKLHSILGKEFEADLVRIIDWILPEPIAILQSGYVACSVHHGGANSFNEAVIAGVPQIVLPQWTDCYDYAQRVEMLGIGRLGNKETKPQWSSQELAQELSTVLFGEECDVIRNRARELAGVCRGKGSGAVNAARILLQGLLVE